MKGWPMEAGGTETLSNRFCCLHLRSWRPDHIRNESWCSLVWGLLRKQLVTKPPPFWGTHIFLWSQIDVPFSDCLVTPITIETPGYKIQNRWTITWIGSYNIKSSNCIFLPNNGSLRRAMRYGSIREGLPRRHGGKPQTQNPAPKSDAENSHFRFECSVLATWSDKNKFDQIRIKNQKHHFGT